MNKTEEKQQRVLTLLEQASHACTRAREMALLDSGISLEQLQVLGFVITASEPVTPARLARHVFREPHTISGLIARMEAAGLINRMPATNHGLKRNQVVLTATNKGEVAYKKISRQDPAQEILAGLGIDADALIEALSEIRRAGLEVMRKHQKLSFGGL